MSRVALAVAVLRQEATRFERFRRDLEETVRPRLAQPVEGQSERAIWYTATIAAHAVELAAVVVRLTLRAAQLEACERLQAAAHARLGGKRA